MAPMANTIGVLANPNNPSAEFNPRDAQTAAETLGKKLIIIKAGTDDDIDAVFATFVRDKVGAVLVDADPFFLTKREQVLAWTEAQASPRCRESRGGVANPPAPEPRADKLRS